MRVRFPLSRSIIICEGKVKKLSKKHKRFCEEYVVDLNATQAAIRAGYSAKSAGNKITQLLSDERAIKYIQDLQSIKSEELRLEREDNLKMLCQMRDAKVTDFLMIDGDKITFKNISDIPEALQHCIKSIKQKTDREGIACGFDVEFYSKTKAIELLNKMMGWDEPEKVEVSGGLDFTIEYIGGGSDGED